MNCVFDDLIRFSHPAQALPLPSDRRLTDAQGLTTALLAARFFDDKLVVAEHYMEQHWAALTGQKRLHAATTRAHRYAAHALCHLRAGAQRPAHRRLLRREFVSRGRVPKYAHPAL